MAKISLTVDLEDPSGEYSPTGRYVDITKRLLDILDENGRKATFFTVGRLAKAAPKLVSKIAGREHEIAYHSHSHLALGRDNQADFRENSRADKMLLEDLSGKSVSGFRAPFFSLKPEAVWASDVLAELGFAYSSSVKPSGTSLFGFKDAPPTPFRWPSGLIEFPLPTAGGGGFRFPFLGGIYLYCLPFFAVRRLIDGQRPQQVLWTYLHPYDFDAEGGFFPIADTSLPAQLLLWLARKRALTQLRNVMDAGEPAPTLGEVAAKQKWAENLPVFYCSHSA